MAKLINRSKGVEIAASVAIARDFVSRAVGLLGRKSMPSRSALWIHNCDSVHTFFMQFALDVVFVDKNLVVTRIYRNLKPWRVTMPALARRSVFELPAGTLDASLEQGDQLHVGD